jgi:AcrR family transcriptional regulator
VSDITRGSLREPPTRAQEIHAVGLRDDKRRRTRRHIAQVATGLFLDHGFAQVTIAEVARTAEVSVNTVYSYFPSKEDLVFYPEEASAQRIVQMVGERLPGQSAAAAVLSALRAELRHGDRMAGLTNGPGRFLRMVRAEPVLAARLDAIGRSMVDTLAATLATETAAATGDPLPHLIAAHLGWIQDQLFHELATRATDPPEAVTRAALSLLDTIEGLLSKRVLTYATR